MKLGVASAEYDRRTGVWGGAGWARIAKYRLPSEVGTLIALNGRLGVRDDADHFDLDVLFMQRYMHDIAGQVRDARTNGQVIINDVDDWFWGLRPSNVAFAAYSANPTENMTNYRRTLAASSAVIVSTPYLRDRLSEWVKCPIEVLPNTVDVDAFDKRHHSDGVPVIGWAGTTVHRSGDLETLRGVLSQVEGVSYVHVGHFDGAPTFAHLAGVEASTAPLVTPDDYGRSLTFDIGIVPLTDTPFNRAKSFIKGLEYTAAGIPFVAPAWGEYLRLHDEWGIGRVAKTPKHWVRHLNELKDPEVRTKEAAQNLERLDGLRLADGRERLLEFLHTCA